jgi:hypothetical protein
LRNGQAGISQSKSVRAIKAPKIVNTLLFPKFRRAGNERKTKAKAPHGKQFGS